MEWNWGEYRMVNPKLIVMDHAYQREQKQSVIDAISANPDPRAFGVPICFERSNGVLYCADGQQRITGILQTETPPKVIPAVVFQVNGVENEAHIFYLINVFRKGLTPFEKHRGGVVAKHPAAVGIERVVESLGLSIGPSGKNRQIGTISALRWIWDRSGEEVLKDTLVLAHSSWEDERACFDTFILRALSDVVADAHSKGRYDRPKLQASLTKTTPSKILRRAEEIHYAAGTSKLNSVKTAMRTVLKV